MLRATAISVLLSLLFVVTYGGTNWLTAQRPSGDVQSWFFAWELTHIPYVPLLIVPYMSMDIFFFFATFLCRDDRELKTFAKRVVFSILVAAAFFLVMPLTLHWPARPHVEGWFGAFVEQSCTAPFLMEYPHNLFPSLHITLCLIVADVYTRHTRGILRAVLVIWFFLIGISTLCTWQHHVVDLAGGIVLAAFAFYAFREADPHSQATRSIRIGCYYLAAAIAVLAMAPTFGLWGAFILWPAAALGITAGAYFGFGADIFRKSEGRLPWSTRFVLAPILLGHYLSHLYYRRQCRAWDEVAPSVVIGRALSDVEAAHAVHQGVTAVLDLTAEFAEATPFLNATYKNLPTLDLTAPTLDQMCEAVEFIAQEAAWGIVYVHCKIGYSRSAAIVGAYLLAAGLAQTVDEAIAFLRQARPTIVIRPEAMEALRRFADKMWDHEMFLAQPSTFGTTRCFPTGRST
jgi:protein-tyrosine phosphatase/membrane-associated phospholipid phosphatase